MSEADHKFKINSASLTNIIINLTDKGRFLKFLFNFKTWIGLGKITSLIIFKASKLFRWNGALISQLYINPSFPSRLYCFCLFLGPVAMDLSQPTSVYGCYIRCLVITRDMHFLFAWNVYALAAAAEKA